MQFSQIKWTKMKEKKNFMRIIIKIVFIKPQKERLF